MQMLTAVGRHGPWVTVSVAFHCYVTLLNTQQLKEGRVYDSSHSEGTVHPGRKVMGRNVRWTVILHQELFFVFSSPGVGSME